MKTLVISHMPFLSYDAMGKTFCSLFSKFTNNELCQFYIYPSIPDIDKCESCFRITDKDVLHNFLKSDFGKEVTKEEIAHAKSQLFENSKDENLYRTPANKRSFRMILRDLMWLFSHWYNRSLKAWINREQPSIIFVAPGTAKFIYNIALKISRKFNLPIVTYVCDDYYFVQNNGSILKHIQVSLLKRKIEKLMKHTCEIISICDEIKTNYESNFNVPCTTIMTGSSFKAEDSFKYYVEEKHDKNAFVYLGNVRCNRYKSLVEIGQALEIINSLNKSEYKLKIYMSEKDENILKRLKSVSTIELCGYVSGEEFLQTLCSAEVLVHTESFDDDMIDLVKNSISTKIADSLASGRKFFAYGPENIASIKYLKSNDAAYVATNSAELEEMLLGVITENGSDTIAKAKDCALKNHDSAKTSMLLHERLDNLSN